ncbi:STM0539 family protein, partial [Salmonella enterica]|uniref:STM0539 family protein n=2 Tax=Enterobacteriaceae TaxID=543 RepID=UPI00300FBE8B
WLMMSLWDALRMNMMISYQELVRTFPKSPDNKDIKMQVPLNVVKEGNLKAGDKVTLEKTQEGTGAYLKKEGKVLAHMVNQDDAGLSSNQTVPAK